MSSRVDSTTDPVILNGLLEVRRGTSFLSRKINELQDSELREDSLLDGWSRAHLIAHIGYNARALCRLSSWANTGVEQKMYLSAEARVAEIEWGSSLQPHALRHLFEHSAISLNVEWRDTPDDAWQKQVKTASGRWVPFSETIWMRLREVWVHAIDLANGARWTDLPLPLSRRLLQDVVATWSKQSLPDTYTLSSADGYVLSTARDPENYRGAVHVRGSLADLLAWATGRSTTEQQGRLTPTKDGINAQLPVAPKWI